MVRNKQYVLYIIFALLSTLINIVVQWSMERILLLLKIDLLSLVLIKNISIIIIIKMFFGTVAAFIFKYIVDKVIIFKDDTKELKENLKKILLYGFFAVFTTLIFWGCELSFKYLLQFNNSEYLGGVIGLAIGYTIKFILDKKFVFSN